MQPKPEIGSVVGPASQTQWGQVLMLPNAYGVVEVEDPGGQARERGINVLTKITDLVGTQPTSLGEVEAIAKNVIENEVVTLALLVPVGMIVYFVMIGAGAIYLRRKEELSCLLKEPGGLSGQLQVGDTILLVSRGFTQILSQEDVAGVFDHLTAKDAAEKLTLMIHEVSGGVGSAGLIFQVAGEEPVEEEEPVLKQEPITKSQTYMSLFKNKRELKNFVKRRIPSGALSRIRSVRTKLPSFSSGRNKLLFLVTLVFFILFSVSVLLGILKQGFGTQSQEVTKAYTDAQHAFDEGVALMELNPVKGRQRLGEAKSILLPLTKTVSTRSKEGRQIITLYKQVLDNLTQAMHVTRAEPALFYDVSLLKKGGQVSAFGLSDETLAIVDKTTQTAYTLGIQTKNGQIVGGGDSFGGVRFVSMHGADVFVFTDRGIHKIDTSQKKVTEAIIKKDDTWGTIGSLVSFGGNLYLLDTTKSRIWKYIATDNSLPADGQGFSERREYLNPDTLPDLSRATGMAIDASVFMATTDGKILRFTQGKENTFAVAGVDPPLGNDLIVYTSDEVKNIYILDRQNKRVVQLGKDGIYLSQYAWEGNIMPNSMVVSEKSTKILLLAEGKIYGLDLK